MKALNRLFATLFLLCIAGMAIAQDVIVMKDQSTIMSKVLEITSTEIKYKKWNNQDGPTYSINRSEVVSINYENGEVENFSKATQTSQDPQPQQVQLPKSYMKYGGSNGRLYLNDRILTDNEVHSLLDDQSYQRYLKGRMLVKTGFVLDVVGGASLLVATGIRVFSTDLNTTGPSAISSPNFKKFMAFAIVGGVSLGTGIILGLFGTDNTKKVAESYNNRIDESFSLIISPSLMLYETPQPSNNYGLGLTINMNF